MTNYEQMDSMDSVEDSILDIDTSDAVEPAAVVDGEYLLRITGQRKKDSKVIRTGNEDNQYFIISFDIPSEPTSKGFSKIFSIPSDSMDLKKRNSAKWAIENFKRCFGLSELNWDAMIGKEGWALLTKVTKPPYGEQNEISKFMVPAF